MPINLNKPKNLIIDKNALSQSIADDKIIVGLYMEKMPKNIVNYRSKSNKKKFLEPTDKFENNCMNASCKLRKAGCRGFEGCPGYKGK